MKFVFLNTCRGEAGEPFLKFVHEEAKNTEVFCFMEASKNVVESCHQILPSYAFVAKERQYLEKLKCEQATFFAPHITLLSSETLFPMILKKGSGFIPNSLSGIHISTSLIFTVHRAQERSSMILAASKQQRVSLHL